MDSAYPNFHSLHIYIYFFFFDLNSRISPLEATRDVYSSRSKGVLSRDPGFQCLQKSAFVILSLKAISVKQHILISGL